MSAERFVLCALLLLPHPLHAQALEPVRELVTPFQDPLATTPEELDAGVALPGDSRPVGCPMVRDSFSFGPLALAEAVDLALCNNAQIKATWAEIKLQAANAGVARSAYLPTLSGSISRREDTTRYPGSSITTQRITNTPINSVFSWRLLDFGTRGANHDAAMLALAAALASHHAMLQQTLATVVQDYFNAQVALAVWQAKESNEKIAGNTLEAAKRRETKGAGTSSDTLQAATALARATLEKNRAQGAYRKAMSVLFYGLGMGPQTDLALASDLDEPSGQAARNLEEWIGEVKKSHPAIVAARAQLESARHRVTATRAEGLPSLDVTAGYYDNGRLEQSSIAMHSRETVFGITLSFPLFEGFSRTYKVRASEAQVERLAAELYDTEHRIVMEVVKAHADAVSALHNLDASAKLLTAAQEALQASQRKYEKGAADILELLNTQAAFADARQERIRGLAEWRAARLRLLACAGAISRADLTPAETAAPASGK
ncbi:MAG: TolC family protein [Desulfobulbus sp.]|nr:TolC family protein [Desulfobulbus sp.]